MFLKLIFILCLCIAGLIDLVLRFGSGGGQEVKNAICILGLNMVNDKVTILTKMAKIRTRNRSLGWTIAWFLCEPCLRYSWCCGTGTSSCCSQGPSGWSTGLSSSLPAKSGSKLTNDSSLPAKSVSYWPMTALLQQNQVENWPMTSLLQLSQIAIDIDQWQLSSSKIR